jgi:hypothetical protein
MVCRALLWQVLPVLTSALAIAVRAAGTGAVSQVLRAAGRLLECTLQLLPRLDDGESCLAVLLEPLQVMVLTGGPLCAMIVGSCGPHARIGIA